MWQIPCKMTNSSSKPLQTLGKWYQPRNPKKNPKPAQKKNPKTISHPFMEAWEKKSMVFDMKTWRKILQNSINLLGSKHLRSPGMVAERVWLGTVRLCIHAYKYCKDIIYIYIHTYQYIYIYIHSMVVDLRFCTYFMLKIQRLALISRKLFLGDPSRFPFFWCAILTSAVRPIIGRGPSGPRGQKCWLALNQQIAVIQISLMWKDVERLYIPHRIHVWYIWYANIWGIYILMVNVTIYT